MYYLAAFDVTSKSISLDYLCLSYNYLQILFCIVRGNVPKGEMSVEEMSRGNVRWGNILDPSDRVLRHRCRPTKTPSGPLPRVIS